MNKFFIVIPFLLLAACNPSAGKKNDPQDAAKTSDLSEIKVPVYAWMGGPGRDTDEEIKANFTELKNKGIIGLMYNGGHDPRPTNGLAGLPQRLDWNSIPGSLP